MSQFCATSIMNLTSGGLACPADTENICFSYLHSATQPSRPLLDSPQGKQGHVQSAILNFGGSFSFVFSTFLTHRHLICWVPEQKTQMQISNYVKPDQIIGVEAKGKKKKRCGQGPFFFKYLVREFSFFSWSTLERKVKRMQSDDSSLTIPFFEYLCKSF